MATIVGSRSPLFYKKVAGGLATILEGTKYTGNIFYVDSAVGTDGAGYGSTPGSPFATIDYAIGKCTANQGDIIIVLPGHAETVAVLITADIAGISIIGLGEGHARPALTVSAVIDGISVTVDDVKIENLRFVTPSAAATSLINIAAARAKISKCRFELGANVVDAVTITAAGEEPTFEDCEVVVTADGPDSWLKFEGVIDRPIVRRCHVIGSNGAAAFDDGVFDFNNVAVTNPIIINNVFDGADVATTVMANVGALVGDCFGDNIYAGTATDGDTVGSVSGVTLANDAITAAKIAADAIGATEIADGAIDAATFAAGAITAAAFAANAIAAAGIAADAITNAKIADNAFASEQFALSAGEKTTDGIVVTRATGALPQTNVTTIFTVTGLCLIKRIVGYVTTVIGAVPNATKLSSNSTGAGATTDLCATVELNNAAADSRLEITGTLVNAMVKTTDIAAPKTQLLEVVVPPGTIEVNCAGNDGAGGRVRWSVTYVPMESGAQIVAA